MADDIIEILALGPPPWQTWDPFLFCVHHDDAYPAGNDAMGPAASLAGRNLGMDFEGKDGWRMYHGEVIPGFPAHPHRGFETVTLARRGFIDHSDSLGATARFGGGDVQWMTAGKGIVHSEMFPLVDRERPNPGELFQIWLNLPHADKLVDPHFAMLWNDQIPVVVDGGTTVTVIAGAIGDARPPSPPPHSWAARADSDVAIWTIRMAPGATWTPPRGAATSNRSFYVFAGDRVDIGDRTSTPNVVVRVRPTADIVLRNTGAAPAELLMLQGKPIGEPVVQYGPFVMSTTDEIQQAMIDFRRTRFGGWPWRDDAPVHARDAGRFARHADGHIDSPPSTSIVRPLK